jgi:hypothetical protein
MLVSPRVQTSPFLTNTQNRRYETRDKPDPINPSLPVHIRLDRTPNARAGNHKKGIPNLNKTRLRKWMKIRPPSSSPRLDGKRPCERKHHPHPATMATANMAPVSEKTPRIFTTKPLSQIA